MEEKHTEGVVEEYGASFQQFASEIESHYKSLIGKASTAPKDAYEHWEG